MKDILLEQKDALLAEKDMRLAEKDRLLLICVICVVAVLVAAAAAATMFVVEKERQKERFVEEKEQQKERLVEEKQRLVEEKQRLVEEKQRLVEEKEKQLAKSEAEATTIRSRYQAVWNLRPVLETHVTKWFIEHGNNVPHGGQEKLNAYKLHGLPNRSHFEDHLDHAMRLNHLDPTKRNEVNVEIGGLYHALSKIHHSGDPPDNVKGFVINHDAAFSAAVSTFFMSLDLPHTVLREKTVEGYQVVYQWPVSDNEPEEEEGPPVDLFPTGRDF